MWYDVETKEIILSDFPKFLPFGVERVRDDEVKSIKIKWSDEGFNTEDFAEVLKLAKRKGSFKVSMQDHKGATSFKVKYGPDYFEEC